MQYSGKFGFIKKICGSNYVTCLHVANWMTSIWVIACLLSASIKDFEQKNHFCLLFC